MIVAVGAVLVLGIAIIGYLLVRGREVGTISQEDFVHRYDELVAKGEIVDDDRQAAWRDFDAWQQTNDSERRSWDEESAG